MHDKSKTKEELIKEINKLRQQVAALEAAMAEQKKTEERLQESGRKYFGIFENASEAIYLIDTETLKILDCNPKASEITGYTTKELLAMELEDLFPIEEQDVVAKIFSKVVKKGSLSGITGINLLRKDRKLIPVEINASTIKLRGRKLNLSFIRDITERKRIENGLKESEERYRSLFRHMFIGCALHKVIVDETNQPIDYTFLEINEAFERLTGLKRKNIIGKRVTEVIPDIRKTNPDLINVYGKVALTGEAKQFELYFKPFNKWHSVSVYSPLKGYFVTLFDDITDRKKVEKALKESEKQYRNLVDNSLVGIYKTNLKGDILYVNDAMCRIIGYNSPDEIIAGNVLNTYKDISDRENLIKQLKEHGSVNNFEIELVKKNGDTITVLLSAVLEGDIISGMIMDITERKHMEKRLQEVAIRDDLTGLFNRRGFFTLSDQQRKLADRNNSPMSLIYLDIDGMKAINDELGHKTGDQALIDTANILRKTFRETDIIARIGGDEFAIFLTDISAPDTKRIITDHLQKNLKMHNQKAGRKYELLLSIGIAHYNPAQACSIDELLSQADQSMYVDKRNKIEKDTITLTEKITTERRSFKRFRTYGKYMAEFNGPDRAEVKDMSEGGIRLKTLKLLPVNTHYKIRMLAPDNEEIKTSAVVVWSSRQKSEIPEDSVATYYETGMKFTDLNERMKKSLKKIVNKLPT